jgi:hypothetical protein
MAPRFVRGTTIIAEEMGILMCVMKPVLHLNQLDFHVVCDGPTTET